MSLAIAALQLAALKALDGKVDASVFFGAVEPRALSDESRPIVTIYADSGTRDIDGREIWAGTHTAQFVLEIGVARKGHQADHGRRRGRHSGNRRHRFWARARSAHARL
jgi:hypothetical protein